MKMRVEHIPGYLLRGVQAGKLTSGLFLAALAIRDSHPEVAKALTALRDELDAVPVSGYYRELESEEIDVEVVEAANV